MLNELVPSHGILSVHFFVSCDRRAWKPYCETLEYSTFSFLERKIGKGGACIAIP